MGTPLPPPADGPPRRRSARLSRAVLIVGCLLAVVAVGGFVFLGVSSRAGLLAFVGVGASSAPMTAEERIVAAFVETAVRDDATFHVRMTASMQFTEAAQSAVMEVNADLDASGADWSGRYSVEINGVPVDADMVVKDEVGYVRRVGHTEWQEIRDDPAAGQPINPFLALGGSEDVEYVGAETRDGVTLHHLRIAKWIGDDLDAIQGLSNVEVLSNSFDVSVTDAGVPVSGTHLATLAGDAEGRRMTANMSADYEFSDWGKPKTIEPPLG